MGFSPAAEARETVGNSRRRLGEEGCKPRVLQAAKRVPSRVKGELRGCAVSGDVTHTPKNTPGPEPRPQGSGDGTVRGIPWTCDPCTAHPPTGGSDGIDGVT